MSADLHVGPDGQETLLHAAERLLRFIRIDDNHGGLLSVETVKACVPLEQAIVREKRKHKGSEESEAV